MKVRPRVCVNVSTELKVEKEELVGKKTRGRHKAATPSHRETDRWLVGWMDGRTAKQMDVVWNGIESEPFRCFYNVSTVWNMHKTEKRAHKITGKKIHTLSFPFYNQATAAASTAAATVATEQKRQQQKLLYCISIKFINRLQSFYIVTHTETHTHTHTSRRRIFTVVCCTYLE